MAKRTREAVLETELGVSPIENDIAHSQNRILTAVDASSDNVTWDIRIYKIDAAKGNAENWIFSVMPDELDSIFTRCRDGDGYGTGVYRMRAYQCIGQDKQVFAQSDFRVLAPPKPAAAPERASEMTVVLDAIQKQNAMVIDLLRDQRHAPPAPPDMWGELNKMVAVIKGLMDTSKPVAATVVQQPQQDVFAAVLKGVELADRLQSDRGETTIYDVLKETLRALPSLAHLSALQPNPSTQRRLPKPTQITTPAEAVAIDPASLKQNLGYLIGKAKKGASEKFYAAWLTDNWDADTIRWALSQPDILTVAQSIEPAIAEHRQWFTGLIDALRAMVNNAGRDTQAAHDAAGQGDTPGSAIADTGGESGSDGDIENHVRVGEGW
jgi:hypothetical protein